MLTCVSFFASLRVRLTLPAAGLQVAAKAIDVRPGHNVEHVVIGCAYKEQVNSGSPVPRTRPPVKMIAPMQALKPNILDEVSGDRSTDIKPEPRLNYCSAGDSVILEDESGRLPLTAGKHALVKLHAPATPTLTLQARDLDHCRTARRLGDTL